jgi:multiple sugar transport system ATP-binding protein
MLDVTEPMGNEIFLYARTPGHEVVARVAPQPLPDPGQPVELAFDLTKLHFFDPETEEAILAGDRARAEKLLAARGAGSP